MTLSETLDTEIRNHDFPWVEKHLGAPLPNELKELYRTGRVFDLEEIIVDEAELYFCVSEWAPQNSERYGNAWPGTEGRLLMANDGSGNEFHALPEEKFGVVYFFNHETGETESLGLDIPSFIAKLEEWQE